MKIAKLLKSLVIVGAASAALVGQSAFADQDFKGKTLVVGVWGGDIEKLIRDHVVGPLEQETGAKVELLLGGTGDRFAKLYAEKDNPTMDVAFLNIFQAPQAEKDGIVVAPDENASFYKDIWPGMNQGCYAMSLNGLGIVYNKDMIKKPAEWSDLWDPQFKGKIALPPFPGAEANGLLAIAARLAGTDEHDPDAAFAKLKELTPVPLTYGNLDELLSLVDSGEIAAAPIIGGYAMASLPNYDNVAFHFPTDPGPVLVRDMLCIVANSPQPELAKRFAALALNVDTQTAYANKLFFGPTNKNVKLSPEISEKVIDTPEEVNSLVQLDWPYVMSHSSDWTDRWNKEILGN
ncbi:extracellular solute-binding protein [Martelella sp. HB161492]|uniref:extracellular solute-binding protein n=1 Tax=Martelella sp. HB161492 TaxID=2720726 RepID=UPI00158FF4E3|nr:extracellular solute-binding protein [Martelella sp. HB161492]